MPRPRLRVLPRVVILPAACEPASRRDEPAVGGVAAVRAAADHMAAQATAP